MAKKNQIGHRKKQHDFLLELERNEAAKKKDRMKRRAENKLVERMAKNQMDIEISEPEPEPTPEPVQKAKKLTTSDIKMEPSKNKKLNLKAKKIAKKVGVIKDKKSNTKLSKKNAQKNKRKMGKSKD
eukprot:TRINITY_DN8606_c0_g1_i1.p1 TRINITY_DN8606_c0_g1~~TRINITY_DN8606_c0_g1_i1.p1  ORF type:complete len:127 (-),score=93.68 TRINITY_DN8606_c0_g1_i1:130-510(-)